MKISSLKSVSCLKCGALWSHREHPLHADSFPGAGEGEMHKKYGQRGTEFVEYLLLPRLGDTVVSPYHFNLPPQNSDGNPDGPKVHTVIQLGSFPSPCHNQLQERAGSRQPERGLRTGPGRTKPTSLRGRGKKGGLPSGRTRRGISVACNQKDVAPLRT